MAILSMFYGIIVSMFYGDNKQHKTPQLRLVQAWITLHADKLMANNADLCPDTVYPDSVKI